MEQKISKKWRRQKLVELKTDPHYGKVLRKCKKEDLEIIDHFIWQNDKMTKNEFMAKANRYFLNSGMDKSRFSLINEILCLVSGPINPRRHR